MKGPVADDPDVAPPATQTLPLGSMVVRLPSSRLSIYRVDGVEVSVTVGVAVLVAVSVQVSVIVHVSVIVGDTVAVAVMVDVFTGVPVIVTVAVFAGVLSGCGDDGALFWQDAAAIINAITAITVMVFFIYASLITLSIYK